MATKFDTTLPLFLGETPVREATTFGQIRLAVSQLDKGEGVSYEDLEAYMLANYTPTKSKNYDGSFIKSYVRDAVGKFGYLSHENLGAEYTAVAPVEKKAASEPKEKPLTKAQKAGIELLAVIRDKGEVSDVSELDSSKITVETLVQETKKKTKTIEKMVSDLEAAGNVRSEQVEDSTYVFLTAAGFALANEHHVPGEPTDAPAESTVEGATEEDTSEA